MSEWISCTLGDVAECIQTGPFGSQLHQSDYSVTGIPVVMPQDMVNGRIDTADIARVEQHHVDRLKRHKLQEGDIVYSRRGDVGRCAYVEKHQEGWLCGTGCLLVRLDKAKVHPRFIAYYLRLPSQVTWVENNAVGITMLNLNTGILSKAPLRIPRSIDEQKRIADTLESMDAKIKHNIELIQTLEEQAQLVYDYWFMQFDFPDENGRPYRSSGGKMKWCEELKLEIPEGWKAATVRDYVKICNGKDHKAVGAGSIPCYGSGGYMLSVAAPIYEGESVLLPRKGTLNNVMLVNEAFWTVDTMFYTRPLSKGAAKYTYYSVRLYDLASMNLGTGVPSMTSTRLYDLKMVGADPVLLEEFDDIVEPMLKRVRKLREEITHLAAQRDFLLPRLMTGEITVAD